jgi:hypothetical protein
MANRPIRFGQAQGLEITADRYAQGHERLENAEIDLDDVIRKRDGAKSVPLTRDGGAVLEQPVDLFFRARELAVSDGERLYAQRTCALEPAASTGSFVERGAWSRGTLQESVGAQEAVTVVLSAVRLEMPPDEDGHTCALEAWTTSGAVGVRARNLGDGLEDVVTVDAAGSQVRGGMVDTLGPVQQGLLSWQTTSPADTIQRIVWLPGQVALAGQGTVFAAVMVGDPIKRWDFAGEPTLSGGFGVWCAITGTQTLSVRARRSSDGLNTAVLAIALPAVSTARRAAAIAISPTPISSDVYRITVAAGYQAGGNERYAFASVNYDVAANTLTLVAGPTQSTATILGTMTALAIAASPINPTTEVHALVERDNSGTSTQLHVGTYGVGDTLLRTMHRCGLVSQFRSVQSNLRAHRNLVVICEMSEALLANGYFLCEPFRPPGPFSGALPYEVYGRAWVGQARVTRGNVVGTQSLVGAGDVLLFAAEGRTDPGETLARQVAQARFELQRTPMPPASLDRFVVQAMGGFARFYDGVVSAEHDWHTLPVITAVGNAGGGLTAGARYTVAVQFWWPDATGREHRSAFSAFSVVLAAGQGTVTVTINTLQITERFGVRALTYISDANGAILYRRSSDPIGSDRTTSTVVVIPIVAVDTSAEQLDTESIGGDQASITGFCALAGGRLWAPSSRRANLAQFSAFPTEGFTPRWDIDSLVEFPEAPTVIRELEGRAIVLGRTRVSALLGDGPDNTGGGDDYAVKDVPTPLGGRSQAGSAQMPLGLLYDSGRGPRLLDRGLSVQDVGAAVSREYDLEGETVRSAAFDASRGVVHLVGAQSGEVLLFGSETLRWARDVRDSAVMAVAVDERGQPAWLRAEDVLVAVAEPSYPTLTGWLFASAGIVPAHAYNPRRLADHVTGDPLVVEGAATVVPVTGAPGILGSRALRTANLNGEALRATDTTIGAISTSLAGAAFVRLRSAAAGCVLGKQNGVLEGWSVLHDSGTGYQVLVANSAGVTSTSSLTLASSVLDVWRVLVWLIDLVTGDVQIASDLEVGAATALPAGTLEALGIPLRFGDARLPPSTVRAIDGDNGGVVLWRPSAPASLDVLALAQQLKTAWDSAAGIPTTRDTRDGDVAQRLLFSSGWLRAEDAQGSTHLAFRQTAARLAGEYEGDHALVARLYADYDDSAPVATYRKSELDVAINRYAGRQYLYRCPAGGETGSYRAIRWEIEDSATETASFRASRLDLALEVLGPGQAEADEELDVPEV